MGEDETMKTKWRLIASAAFAIGFSGSGHAWAQAASGTTEGLNQVNEIIVRAQRREQAAIDVPVQVSSLSAEALVSNNVKTLEDIGDRIPNSFFGANSGYGTPAFSIRGVGGTLSTGGEEPVAIFFDDQFIPRTLPSALLDVESVEVLRGPQGTLYGRNATAGAILIRSARPDLNRVTGFARGQVGNFDEQNLEGAVSLPLSATFGVRVAGLYNHSDGWVTNTVNGAKLSRSESGRGRISMLWQPSDKFELYGNFEYGKQTFAVARAGIGNRTGGGNRVLISPAAMNALRNGDFAADSPVNNNKRDARATLTATVKFDGFDLVAAGGYYYTRFGGNTDSDGSGTHLLFNTGQFKFKTYTGDLRLISNGGGRLDWILGFSAIDDTYNMPYFYIGNVATNAYSFFAGKIPATSYAAYAEVTYKLTDQLSITAGGRYTYEKKKANVRFQGNNLTTGLATTGLLTFSDKDHWTAFKPRGIIQFEASNNVNFYASISTGFKSGGYNVFARLPAYNDENIIAYEGGVKGRFLDNMMTASAAVFHYDYSDLQLRLGVPAGGVIIQNAADATVDGFELEASLTPRNGLEIYGTLSILDAKIKSYQTRNLAGALVNASDARMSRAPKFSYSFGGSYEYPISESLFARLAASFTYRSKVYFLETDQDAPTFRGSPLSNLDMRATIGRSDKSWQVSLFTKNLTNDVEVTQVELQGNFPMATFNQPRRYGLEIATRF